MNLPKKALVDNCLQHDNPTKKNPINFSEMLKFLAAIQNADSRTTILEMLSSRLNEEGFASYKYSSLNPLLSTNRFKILNKVDTVPTDNELENTFRRVSKKELSKPSIIRAKDSPSAHLIFPVFGPYRRAGIFILQSSVIINDSFQNEICVLDMVLQKTHVAIAKIEARNDSELLNLTPRETDVLACISSGLNNQEVADLLKISIHTVNGYLRTIMIKFRTHDKLSTGLAGLSTPGILSRARRLISINSRIG